MIELDVDGDLENADWCKTWDVWLNGRLAETVADLRELGWTDASIVALRGLPLWPSVPHRIRTAVAIALAKGPPA